MTSKFMTVDPKLTNTYWLKRPDDSVPDTSILVEYHPILAVSALFHLDQISQSAINNEPVSWIQGIRNTNAKTGLRYKKM